ncbi:uncharacterized protein LOC111341591 [Stylophora pistillata]|nr:uncharacterized protein LOC111341591 [Stylophora pistillata]
MLHDPCVRRPYGSSTNSVWFSVPSATKSLKMDLIEGRVRYRKGKKWKLRWAVLRRVNPATDVLNLVLYPDRHPDQNNAGARHKALLSLKEFSGLQVLNKIDKHFNVIVIITTEEVIPLSFETIDQRADWLALLQGHFGKEKSFEGIVPHKQKIKAGEAHLRFYATFFSLTKKDSYRLIGHWKFTALPKYGAVEAGFAFQASQESQSGDKLMTYFFATRAGKEIHALFDSVCRAGEVVPGQECLSESGQPGTSEEDGSRPGFLRRAWLRMSGKRSPKKGKAPRPRSMSMPSSSQGKKNKAVGTEQKSPIEAEKPLVRRNESVPSDIGGGRDHTDSFNEVFLNNEKTSVVSPKIPPPGYQNIPGVTPEGYQVMEPADDEAFKGRKSSGVSATSRKKSQGKRQSGPENGKVDEVEGYVEVDGRDEELLEKIRTNSYAKEKRGDSVERTSRGSDGGRTKSSASEKRQSDKVANSVIKEEEGEEEVRKKSEIENQRASKGLAQCQIIVTPSNETDEEKLKNGSEETANIDDVFLPEGIKTVRVTSDNADKNPDYVNGDITLNGASVKAVEKHVNGTSGSVSTRRGMKTPPSLSLQPTSTAGSAEHLYVNSPKIVDYVNVKGARTSPGGRSRVKTGVAKTGTSSKSRLNPYAIYDGNDDSIYHSVESLMPSHPGYQNVMNSDPSRSHSFENIAGHSYANVMGGHPSYQNIGHRDRMYVNVMSQQNQGNLNYIKLEGVDSSHGSSPFASTSPKSAKPSSDYTWIDERKTKLLADTAKLHSERRQENLPRVMKK